MRSKLFVPGARPELFAKAMAGDADALSLDLEDSVRPQDKASARDAVAQLVASDAAHSLAKTLIVRINAADTPWFHDDLRAVVHANLALLNLPKIESPDDVHAAVRALEAVEADAGIDQPISLLLNIETPRGFANAGAIAAAHQRVAGLQLGLADLFEPLGIDRRDPANVHAVLFALRMAAAQSGVYVMDGAFPDIADDAGFSEEAQRARRLGYLGKSCIHPRQVALANLAFMPTADELAWARQVVETATHSRHGAFQLQGRMVDAPFVLRARRLLQAIERGGGD